MCRQLMLDAYVESLSEIVAASCYGEHHRLVAYDSKTLDVLYTIEVRTIEFEDLVKLDLNEDHLSIM